WASGPLQLSHALGRGGIDYDDAARRVHGGRTVDVELELALTTLALGKSEALSKRPLTDRADELDLGRRRRSREDDLHLVVSGALRSVGLPDGPARVTPAEVALAPPLAAAATIPRPRRSHR